MYRVELVVMDLVGLTYIWGVPSAGGQIVLQLPAKEGWRNIPNPSQQNPVHDH